LFIYLFLREMGVGVAKRLLNLYRRPRGTIAEMGPGAERFSEKSRKGIRPKNWLKPERRVKKLWTQPVRAAALS
jgi:hypothetical protein